MIEVQGLTKRYGSKVAVDDISFTVNKGEILGFLGPNGAGKSTTMNILTGYLSSNIGSVKIGEYDILEDPMKAKAKIGYLPENPPLYMDMTVKEYLDFVYDLKKVKIPRKRHIDEICGIVKITDVYNRIIKNLSKGYKQRVGFAQALLGNPKYLVLDEPTVGLDPNQVIEVRNLILSLKKDHTIILSSHILAEIQEVCERVVIISHGEIRAVDKIKNLEDSLGTNMILNMTVEGEKDKATECIKSVEGVIGITDTSYAKTNTYTYRIEIKDDEVRKNVMTNLIKNDFVVDEVTTEKPNLEEVFVKLTSQAPKKKGLKDLLEEMDSQNPYYDSETDSSDNSDKEDE